MGSSSSRTRGDAPRNTVAQSSIANMRASPPQHLSYPSGPSQQYPFQYQRPPPMQTPPAAQQQQQQQQQLPPIVATSTVKEGEEIKTSATINPLSVHFEPDTGLLMFQISALVESCKYQIHTSVTLTVKNGAIVYTPSDRTKREPPFTDVKSVFTMHGDVFEDVAQLVQYNPMELEYRNTRPRFYPCSIVLQWVDPKTGEKQSEHTVVDLSKGKTIHQFLHVHQVVYLVESLFGADDDITVGNVAPDVVSPAEGGVVSGVVEGDTAAGDEDNLCVVCLSEPKDTTVMPCRHMCVCKACAERLRELSQKCPVCRAPIVQFLTHKH